MQKGFYYFFIGILVIFHSCIQKESKVNIDDSLVFIKGGSFQNKKSNLYGNNFEVKDFYMGIHEITQKEWMEVMNKNPSKFIGDSLPVEMVSWYDCIEFCIKKSTQNGLTPYYKIYKDSTDSFNTSKFDSIKWLVKRNPKANGYRLPSEIEWEYVASGGQLTKNYIYSGSNDIDEIAWYWRNSGDTILDQQWNYSIIENNQCKTHKIGTKKPNELGIHDMTGNVREWCDDWYEDDRIPRGLYRSQRGGGWIGLEVYFKNNDRDYFEANGIGPDQGFRICRNKN
ncbi:formylglycine-generating enzyme family protein [Aquimarina litoralis]|uniref:formylglycine-generating enzyme family protein n=1 Tax=Aquimarina litoralis TaxID=584605 RepID=UPI001C575F00|nr:SUMF1/EgtB/PvdO family nonheme iron enzyme [Aquimarina litoralis]MBW1298911.1 SUMF1/EgtB/PvdO family nonheme iron enzyme [Aquimarina litoralis]